MKNAWPPIVASLAVLGAAWADPPTEREHAWPAWRGPTASGVALHGNPPTEWSETKNVRWKVALPGAGHATPIVWGDRVYVQTAVATDRVASAAAPDALATAEPLAEWGLTAREYAGARFPFDPQQPGQGGDAPRQERRRPGGRAPGGEAPKTIHEFTVMALDRATGETVWKKIVREQVPLRGVHPTATQASGSPVTDGEHLYAYFGSYGVYCLKLDGTLVWQRDLGVMRPRNDFGEGSSPALFGDTLVINWDHEDEDFLIALDARTGEPKWRTARDEPTSWSTPLVVADAGPPQVIVPATNRIRSYDLATGKELWECGGLTMNVIPSPVYADGLLYVTSGFRGNALLAIRLAKASGNITDNADVIAWTHNQNTPYVPSPLLSPGGGLYFYDNTRAILTRLDAKTGKVDFGPERLEGLRNVYASPVAAGGHVYLASREGATLVIRDAAKFEVVAKNTLDDEFDASPAVAGDELFLRGTKNLYCIAAK